MKIMNRSLRNEQPQYKQNFEARLRELTYEILEGSYVFLRKYQGIVGEPKHKLARFFTGAHQVKKSDENTVFIAIGDREKRVLRDRVELVPSPLDYTRMTNLRQSLQYLGGTICTKEDSTIQKGTRAPQFTHQSPEKEPKRFSERNQTTREAVTPQSDF